MDKLNRSGDFLFRLVDANTVYVQMSAFLDTEYSRVVFKKL